jgi:hypothetical protein
MRDVDLRALDRHRDGAITALIPALSCRSCRPNAPFAELVRLSKTSIADEMREEQHAAGTRRVEGATRLPLLLQSRHSVAAQYLSLRAMSVILRCSERAIYLFDHLVGDHEEVMRQLEADRSCGPEIESEYELGGLLYRKIGRLLATQNAIDVLGRVMIIGL